MITTTTYGTSKFQHDVREWMALKDKTVFDWLTLCAGVVTKDAMFYCPPRSGEKAGKETWATQKQAGENRIKYELMQLFPSLKVVHVLQNPEHARAYKYFQRYIDERNLSALTKMLHDFGIPVPFILLDATHEAHQGARGQRGRVKTRVRYPIINERSRTSLIKKIIQHVGELKAGFWPAAKALGIKGIPQWISRHYTIGDIDDQRLRKGDPYVAIKNYSTNTDGIDTDEIVRHAVEINERKMYRYIQYQLGKLPKGSAR